jgi:hypothetical protein
MPWARNKQKRYHGAVVPTQLGTVPGERWILKQVQDDESECDGL